jgi:hypothetical protein
MRTKQIEASVMFDSVQKITILFNIRAPECMHAITILESSLKPVYIQKLLRSARRNSSIHIQLASFFFKGIPPPPNTSRCDKYLDYYAQDDVKTHVDIHIK